MKRSLKPSGKPLTASLSPSQVKESRSPTSPTASAMKIPARSPTRTARSSTIRPSAPPVDVSSAAPTITLSASTTIPEVGQPVTFTVKLTGDQVVYGDYYNTILLSSLG